MTGAGTMQAGEFVLQYSVVYCDRQCTVSVTVWTLFTNIVHKKKKKLKKK